MKEQGRVCSWSISDTYFRLITESTRLFSNKVKHLASLGEVVDARAPFATKYAAMYKAEALREHLTIVVTDGDLPFEVEILETSYDLVQSAIPDLEAVIGDSVSFAAAISLMLFDFVVEEGTTHFSSKLNLTLDEAAKYAETAKRVSTKVVPFR